MPTTACSSPSGNGGASGVPRTSCFEGTGIVSSRPGSASSAVTIAVGLENRNMRFRLLELEVRAVDDAVAQDDQQLPAACPGLLRLPDIGVRVAPGVVLERAVSGGVARDAGVDRAAGARDHIGFRIPGREDPEAEVAVDAELDGHRA